jgi:hypothetical protein
MELLVLQDINLTIQDRRFRHSVASPLIAGVIFLSMAVGVYFAYRFGKTSLSGVFVAGGFLLFVALMFLGQFRKAMAPANWLVAVGPDRVLIKFRSYLNAHFPETDSQVVSIDPDKIGSVNITKQKLISYGMRNSRTTSYHTFLDVNIDINGGDLSGLKERLKNEFKIKAQPSKPGGRVRSLARHYPVAVVDADTIRVEWNMVRPGVKKVVSLLSRQGIAVGEKRREVIDLTLTKGDKDNIEDKIVQLIERGNIIAAVKLVRRTYNYNLTEAKEFVEGLLE